MMEFGENYYYRVYLPHAETEHHISCKYFWDRCCFVHEYPRNYMGNINQKHGALSAQWFWNPSG